MDWINVLAQLSTAVSVVIATLVWRGERAKVRQGQRAEKFFALNGKYVEYLSLFASNPHLLDFPYAPKVAKLPTEDRKKYALMEIVICMIEMSVFLGGRAERSAQSDNGWGGWDEFSRSWARDPGFQEAVASGILDDYDDEIRRHITDLVEAEKSRAKHASIPLTAKPPRSHDFL